MALIRWQTVFRIYSRQFTQVRLSSSKKDDEEVEYIQIYPRKKPKEEYDPKKPLPKHYNPLDMISFLSQPIDLSPKAIKNWYQRKRYENVVKKQSNVKERQLLYGTELGAAVFILELNGSVLFKNHTIWTKMIENDRKNGNLPLMPPRGTQVQKINASDTTLLYEGLENLCGLRDLKTLILDNCPFIDDWCLDRLSGRLRNTLVDLKISNCPKITERGLVILSRLKCLETLHLNNLPGVNHPGLVGLLLDEAMPHCKIEGIDYENDKFIDLPESDEKTKPQLHISFNKGMKFIKKE